MELKITSIVKTKFKDICVINFNDGTNLYCSQDLVLKYYLAKDKIISSDVLTAISSDQRKYTLKQVAYNYASYKPRTEKQVSDKLSGKDFNRDEIDFAINFLKEFNFLDDEKFANDFVKYFKKSKKYGKNRIYQELMKRGIDKDLAQSVIRNNNNNDENYTLALEAAKKKFKSLQSRPIEKQKNSLINYLARQGFDWDIIKTVLNEFFNDEYTNFE